MSDNGLISSEVNDDTIAEIAFIFELLSNPVYPMPDMRQVLEVFSKYKLPMGIVSNAQFYTPICMNYFISGKVENRETIDLFNDDLTVYSYQQQIGKPDTKLYELLIEPLKENYGLFPHQVLFVGNDMKKDIAAAQKVGFKTALFAGDMRSLRIREKDPGLFGIKPDFIITELAQLFEILDGFESLRYLN
jgi:putative hydrolase of the HAD superfamily